MSGLNYGLEIHLDTEGVHGTYVFPRLMSSTSLDSCANFIRSEKRARATDTSSDSEAGSAMIWLQAPPRHSRVIRFPSAEVFY